MRCQCRAYQLADNAAANASAARIKIGAIGASMSPTYGPGGAARGLPRLSVRNSDTLTYSSALNRMKHHCLLHNFMYLIVTMEVVSWGGLQARVF